MNFSRHVNFSKQNKNREKIKVSRTNMTQKLFKEIVKMTRLKSG